MVEKLVWAFANIQLRNCIPDGKKDTVGVTESLIIDILERDTSDEAMVRGDNVLIGQTVLDKLDLLVDCANQKVLPNPAHPDQPVLHVR